MARGDVLVVLCGTTVAWPEVEAVVEREVQLKAGQCVLTDLGAVELGSATFDAALCFAGEALSLQQLSAVATRLNPGATFLLKATAAHVGEIRRNALFSGFVRSGSASDELNGWLKLRKPEWEKGAKSEVKAAAPAKWTVAPDEDDEILDDDAFLTAEDRKPAPSLQCSSGTVNFSEGVCAPGGKATVRKACANCTCGAAEGKEPMKLTQEMLDNPVTQCGSCGLGDAYRCATCPYRGLPSFEAGKKIQVPEGFLISDL